MKRPTILLFLVCTLVACGEVSYKRGASVRDIEDAHKSCRGQPEDMFSACMEKQGWKIQKFEDDDLFATATVTDNRMPGHVKHEDESVKANQDLKTDTQTSVQFETNSDGGKVPSSSDASLLPSPQTQKTVEADPLQRYTINSWWKFGASDKKLLEDMQSCESNLGTLHQTDRATQQFTRGFLVCMREHGWRALKAQKP